MLRVPSLGTVVRRISGAIGGIVTCAIPLGTGLGAVLGAFLAPVVGWRGLFAIGVLPALMTLLIRAWVPSRHIGLSAEGATRRRANRSLGHLR